MPSDRDWITTSKKFMSADLERHIYIEWKVARIEADMQGRSYCVYCPLEFNRS